MQKFTDILSAIQGGYTILLDIDGTLTHDGSTEIASDILETLEKLKSSNEIYLCSNKKDHERNRKVSEITGIPYLETELRKPNIKILELLPEKSKKLLVIGDKFLTDGRFARNIGAKFIKVQRITSPEDSLFTKFTFIMDDVFARIFSY